MSISQNTLGMLEEAVKDFKNADTSNTILSLQEIHPEAQRYPLMTKTTYVEFNPASSVAELPSLFARDFGRYLQIYVILQDPNKNQIQVFIKREQGKIYLSRGWSRLRTFYGLIFGGWVTLLFMSPALLHIEVKTLTGVEVKYPHNDPPRKLMLSDQSNECFYNGPVPFYVAPTKYVHTLDKTLSLADAESGVLTLAWDGFCQNSFPHQNTNLTIVDWMGFTWKCQMELHQNNICTIYGEWNDMCRTHKLAEGSVLKFGVVRPSNNLFVYVRVSPFIGVRTTLVAPTTSGGYKAYYQVDNYYML